MHVVSALTTLYLEIKLINEFRSLGALLNYYSFRLAATQSWLQPLSTLTLFVRFPN